MKKTTPTTILAALIGLPIVVSIGLAQDDVPLTVETKTDDYVVTDHRVLDSLARIETYLTVLLERAEPTDDEPQADAININTASYDELLKVPGIGPVKAGSIIAERGQAGEFADWSDLMRRVSGVGPATVADMQAGGAVLE